MEMENSNALTANVDVLGHVNLALLQNGLPVAKDLRLVNGSDAVLRDVSCAFGSDDGVVVPTQLALKDLGPGERLELNNLGLLLNPRRILEVTDEAVATSVRMTVSSAGTLLLERSYPVTLLPLDHWLGTAPYPELLAAYVLPNAEIVCQIQAEAAREIEQATGSASLEGYQGGKKRALETCAAVYAAIRKHGIRYANPPASFGQPGQKLRLPETIEKYKLATCIETSLLMAAVLEKCGLHPVLVLTRNHCYVGCHLVEEMFEEVVVRSLQALRKRAALDEFVAIETTGLTRDTPFNEAEKAGRALLDEEDAFKCAVDVVRSRENGIRPLALGTGFDSAYVAEGRAVGADAPGDVRDLQESVDLAALGPARATQGRIDRWTQKLLDFSARNRLLNIPRTSRQVVRLMSPDVAKLEDQVAANKTIAIRSIADTMGEKALDDLQNGRLAREQWQALVDAELAHGRLCVMLTPQEVRRRMSDLLHDARTNLEESGVNTLFLTIGELQWMEPGSGAGRKAYRAPILMVPVRLERATLAEGVKMYRRDEETTLNTTLVEFLRAQFNLALPGLDPLPTDDSGVDAPLVLRIFRQAIKDLEGWEVFDEATVGCFSFGKFVMWKDMTERVDELKKNPLVNHLVGGGGCFDDGVEIFPAEEVARHLHPENLYCPVSYDSSQLAAVLYSEMGKSFVLHGPPGTGKSQTITNIIAHNLARGRRVLFVSEKKAALDVVKDRLDRIGLTPFCLELHSNKTEKSRFYAQIKAALDVPETAGPAEWDEVAAGFEACRRELNGYIEALHRPYPNGLTAYACFAQAISRTAPARPELLDIDCLVQPRADHDAARTAVQDLATAFRGVAEDALKATPELKADAWTPALERQLAAAAEKVARSADALNTALDALRARLGTVVDDRGRPALATLAGALGEVLRRPQVGRTILAPADGTTSAQFAELLDLQAKHQACVAALGGYRLDTLAELDFDGLARRLEENRRAFILLRFFKNRALVKELSGIVRLGAAPLTADRLAADLPNMRGYVSLGRDFLEKAGCPADELVDVDAGLRDLAAGALERWTDLGKNLEEFLAFAHESSLPADVRELGAMCRALADNAGELRNVMQYRKARDRAQALGVGAFEGLLLAEDDGRLDAAAVFDDAYAAKMLDAILAHDRVLAEFSGLAQDERVAKFRDLDHRHTELARKVVFAKLAASLPRRRSGPCPEGSEMGMVKRECEKKSRQKAVRQLLAESRTLVPSLKPCFLMSPLSVAQYLPVDAEPFDLIVFDEASQIPVWDAIGVIARGRQLIVVGDPKQMPPTNFFQKGEREGENDAEETVLADQESILDECLVAGVFSTYLNWHYRSRHEALIAFSNAHYYSNKLCTFPSALSSPRLGVKFMFVPDGRFTRAGRGPRVNEAEAKALVDYICTEVRRPGYRRRSLGVVTFSMPQQNLIRAMLEERRGEDPELEKLLPEEGEGAYFVKNLENVQGDESDVILFSIGYAPDENGRFTMNFGPLNLSGGERRLNVAVTRAKEQVVVFSSIHASQIDAGEDGRTKAVGAGHLKAFLEYAERGNAVAAPAPSGPSHECFGDVVAAFLAEHGYAVDRDVGCSDYRIDVAVRHPECADRYLMGIECDGPSYARQRTAQDRDVNRAGVLRGLGWNTCRVWSVDWALDRDRAERRLLDELEAARREPDPSARAPAPQPAEPDPAPARPAPAATRPAAPAHPSYRVWKCRPVSRNADFYAPAERPRIAQMVADAVEAEGPVFEDVLRRRVGKVWGLTRMTENVHRVFDACRPRDGAMTRHGDARVYWPKGTSPDAYADYRLPGEDADARRALDEIPPEELRNAMRETLSDFGDCPQDDLYRETLKIFGLSTLTAKARKTLDVAFALLAKPAAP